MNKNFETNRKWKIASVALTLVSVVLIGSNLLNANDADTRVDFSASQQEFQDRYCDFNGLSGSEIQQKFLKSTNDLFNSNIQLLADNEKKRNEELARGGQADNINLANVPPQESDFEKSPFKSLCKDQNDFQCKMFAVCKNNPSSYCVGINAIGFSPRFAGKYNTEEINNNFGYLKTSYSCYKSAMELKKDDVKEASDMRKIQNCLSGQNPDSALCKKVGELEKTSNKDKKAQLNSEIRAILSSEANLTNISDIGAFVVRRENQSLDEINRSKKAIEVTLQMYDQLVTNYRLHKKYITFYNSLVDMKNGLDEVREQTDTFPLKFVDATTTRCL